MKRHVSGMAAVLGLALIAGCGGWFDDDTPAPVPPPAISVSPTSAPIGGEVTVSASGFPANNTIVIGFGPSQSESEVLLQIRTDAAGSVSVRVPVPDWATSGRDYVWVASDRDNEPRVISDRFRVTDG
ncbi:MAG TPA: hypothetical protein VMM12_16485 [Longimicrobiales bacterium]|nr:hypothetical protein [Longimicrobiales bacterium]